MNVALRVPKLGITRVRRLADLCKLTVRFAICASVLCNVLPSIACFFVNFLNRVLIKTNVNFKIRVFFRCVSAQCLSFDVSFIFLEPIVRP